MLAGTPACAPGLDRVADRRPARTRCRARPSLVPSRTGCTRAA